MSPQQAFSTLAKRALTPAKAARAGTLTATEKGRQTILASLDHDFERDLRPNLRAGQVDQLALCYGFHRSVGFGAEFPSVAAAYEHLRGLDGWLIIVADGSAVIYRPEGRWDAEVEIVV